MLTHSVRCSRDLGHGLRVVQKGKFSGDTSPDAVPAVPSAFVADWVKLPDAPGGISLSRLHCPREGANCGWASALGRGRRRLCPESGPRAIPRPLLSQPGRLGTDGRLNLSAETSSAPQVPQTPPRAAQRVPAATPPSEAASGAVRGPTGEQSDVCSADATPGSSLLRGHRSRPRTSTHGIWKCCQGAG